MRPTAARVREALFSIVGQDLSDVAVLDAFGGSGLLGLEAWSRGGSVTIVERDPDIAAQIRRNADALGAHTVTLVVADVRRAALGRFDLVLVDPPYADAPGPILEALAPRVGGTLVLEHDAGTEAPHVAGLERDHTRTYGGTALTPYVTP